MYALSQAETNQKLQKGTGKRWCKFRLTMVLTAIRTIQQEVLNIFEDEKHIEDVEEPIVQQATAFLQQEQLESP